MTNTKMLNDAIEQSGLRMNYIAKKVGLTYQGLRNKIEGKREFKAGEIAALSDVLRLTSETRDQIFFS